MLTVLAMMRRRCRCLWDLCQQTGSICCQLNSPATFLLPPIQSPQDHLRHHRRPRLTLSSLPSPIAQCFSCCESESDEHYLFVSASWRQCIGNGDNVVSYGKDGNMMRITWWQGISTSPTPSLWTGCCREYFWSGSPAPPRSDHQDHVDKDINCLLILMLLLMTLARMNIEYDVAWWCLTSMSATFSRE